MSGDLKYGTHWEDCEIVHHGCALAKLKQEREAFTTYRADVKPVPRAAIEHTDKTDLLIRAPQEGPKFAAALSAMREARAKLFNAVAASRECQWIAKEGK
jgi:hypothetical protein